MLTLVGANTFYVAKAGVPVEEVNVLVIGRHYPSSFFIGYSKTKY